MLNIKYLFSEYLKKWRLNKSKKNLPGIVTSTLEWSFRKFECI